MEEEYEGGPAFPLMVENHGNESIHFFGREIKPRTFMQFGGMTLRDYFAAKALQGMLSDLPKSLYGLEWKEKTAKSAYEIADAMLKARES